MFAPGFFGAGDNLWQLSQAIGVQSLTQWHPILDSLLLVLPFILTHTFATFTFLQ
jgi:hypothetical protein